jgi:hypothetical protein
LPVSAIKNKVPLKDWKKDAQTVFMAVTESENKKHQVSREPEVRLFISSLSFDNPQHRWNLGMKSKLQDCYSSSIT